MTKLIICDLYCRVSTTEQAEEGYSLDEQESRLRAYAAAQGWQVHACHIDPGYSGSKLERPGIQAVIADARAHRINKVVTYKLDRLSRSQRDTLYLIEEVFNPNDVDYVSMTESFDTGSAFGRAVIGILSVFAQLERETIRERMSIGRLAAVRDGSWRGGGKVPVGYRYQPGIGNSPGTIVPDPHEAEVVRQMFQWCLQGQNYSQITRSAALLLPERGQKNQSSWSHSVLRNQIYIGKQFFLGEWHKGDFEPILDEATFWAVQTRLNEYQAVLDARRRFPRQRGHLLTGFLYCGVCGARATFRNKYSYPRNGEAHKQCVYVCVNHDRGPVGGCADSRRINADLLEDAVFRQIESLRLEDLELDDRSNLSEVDALERRLDIIAKQQERLVELFSLGALPAAAIKKQADALVVEQKKLTDRIDALRATESATGVAVFRDALSVAAGIRQLSDAEQRDLLRALIRRIEFYPDHRVEIQWNI